MGHAVVAERALSRLQQVKNRAKTALAGGSLLTKSQTLCLTQGLERVGTLLSKRDDRTHGTGLNLANSQRLGICRVPTMRLRQ